jgi:hypothetical protein
MNVGGNLNLASQQDTDNYTDQNRSSGFNIGTNMASSASESKGNTNSTYASVTAQTGINAGKGGFDINVGGNTDLKGAVISSQATPDKNTISTGTLSFSNINNKAQYSASSSGIDYSWNNGPLKGKDGKVITDSKTGKSLDNPANGLSISPGMPVNGNAGSTTQSAISAGTIQVRSDPSMDFSQLSRNANQTLNSLGKIFDKKTVQEKQQLANLFGQMAYQEVGDISARALTKALIDASKAKTTAEKKADMALAASWDEGGANKILLHSLVGGIMSNLGGNGFASGATGAGLNEAVQGQLAKIKDAGVHQIASALVGAAAAKVIGGNVQAGVSAAVSGTKYNWLSHQDQLTFAKRLRKALAHNDLYTAEQIVEEFYKKSRENAKEVTFDESIESFDNGGSGLLEALQAFAGLVNQTLVKKNGLNFNLANLAADAEGGFLAEVPPIPGTDTTRNAQVMDELNNIQTVSEAEKQGGTWNKSGVMELPDGTQLTNLPSRGDYMQSQGTQISGYDANGVPYIHVNGAGDYYVYNAPHATVDNVLALGGTWNSSGQLTLNGTVYSNLPDRGDYLYQNGTTITGYSNGVAYIHVAGVGDYPVYNAPPEPQQQSSQAQNQGKSANAKEVLMGLAQVIGGGTETSTGWGIATGATAASGGILAPVAITGGGYLVTDGISNVTGGASRVINGWKGSTAGDTLNFMKAGYEKVFPKYGKTAYNITQAGIGAFSIARGGYQLYNGMTSVTSAGAYSTLNNAATKTSWSIVPFGYTTVNKYGILVKSFTFNPALMTGFEKISTSADLLNTQDAVKSSMNSSMNHAQKK